MRVSPFMCVAAVSLGSLIPARPLAAKKLTVKLPPEAYALTPEARAQLALSRLAYGPRPGDIAALSAPGALEAWLNGQLYPGKLKDADLERRLKALPLATMDPDDIQSELLKPFLEAHHASENAGDKDKAATDAKPDADGDGKKTSEFEIAAAADPKLRELASQWQRAQILRAVYSDRQLEAALGAFWFNHFNVEMGGRLGRFTLQDYEREAIRGQVFDSFRDLLEATSHHPAMLFYLENEHSTRAATAPGLSVRVRDPFYDPFDDPFNDWGRMHPVYFRDRAGNVHVTYRRSNWGYGYHHGLWHSLWWDDWFYSRVKPGNSKQLDAEMTGPVSRYARALLELHTLGSGVASEKDVSETARIFTGWSMDPPAERIAFSFIPPAHDAAGAKVLGAEYSGRDGEKEGGELLDALAEHPATARHIAEKFARRFAGDDAPQSLIDRLAARFTATDGDLRQLTVALIESPEFWQAPDAPPRTPLEWTAGLLRASGAETDGSGPLQVLIEMGQAPGACPDPAGYPRDASVWLGENGLKLRREEAAKFAAGQWEGTRPSGDAGAVNPDYR